MLSLPPIAVTTVGSFPRPAWLARQAESRDFASALEGDALTQAQDDATALSIFEQETDGVDLVSDGEQRRPGFVNHIFASWDGIDVDRRRPKATRRKTRERMVPTVFDKVRRREQGNVEDLRFAKAHAIKPVKMTLPGPMTIIDSTFDEAYGDEAALAVDLAAALNAELLDLQAAGAEVLQIDEPAMTRWHEKVAAYGAKALDRCLVGVTVPTFVHLCYGLGGTQDPNDLQYHYEYPELLEMLMETAISGFSLEFARSSYDPAILRMCEGRSIMFGCMDPENVPPESRDRILERLLPALDYVVPDRLLIAPDCGLSAVSKEVARAKCQRLAEVAAAARSRSKQ